MAINLTFTKLSYWQQVAFSAAILERMLPNYQLFSESSEFGDFSLVRNQLNLIWQWLDKNSAIKINATAQLNKLEEQTPEPDNFDFFGVYPALDVCMALVSLLQLIESKGKDKSAQDVAHVSLLSINSVSHYVELLLENDENRAEEEIKEHYIQAHPLMQWEIDTQNELFNFLSVAAENKRSCQLAKELVLSEGISNLGIAFS